VVTDGHFGAKRSMYLLHYIIIIYSIAVKQCTFHSLLKKNSPSAMYLKITLTKNRKIRKGRPTEEMCIVG
jgi:hypothetical protein